MQPIPNSEAGSFTSYRPERGVIATTGYLGYYYYYYYYYYYNNTIHNFYLQMTKQATIYTRLEDMEFMFRKLLEEYENWGSKINK